MQVLRIDDVSDNCCWETLQGITGEAQNLGAEVIWNVSLFVHVNGADRQMPEDPEFIPLSDFTRMFETDRISTKVLSYLRGVNTIRVCSHGMVHVDHRLLSPGAQELSIVTSCALLSCSMFCPPYHKWNSDTEEICKRHNILLLKYETNWLHVKYNPWTASGKYYVHCTDLPTAGELTEWKKGSWMV